MTQYISGDKPKDGYKIDYLETTHQGVPVNTSEPFGLDDMLHAIYGSTKAFHERFDKFPPVFAETVRAFDEELREFNYWLSCAKDDVDLVNPSAMLAEFADMLVTCMSIFQSMGYTYEQIKDATLKVIRKNNAKTIDTHYVDKTTGKITKRK